ncbi:hypothetical protein K439DRAFT_1639105 [Ramaria rubella]|nr:hypothetical protein K439DRAFT_1639105 [Ramaria rubella]
MDVRSLFVALTAARYSIRSAIALFLYDYLLTFPAEVRHFWRRDWSHITMLFLCNRYLGMICALSYMIVDSASVSDKFCQRVIWRIAIGSIASIVNSELILLVRIYAAYQCNLWVLLLTSGLFTASTLTSLLIVIVGVPKAFSLASLGTSGCVANLPSYFFAACISVLIVETVLCLLMGYRAFTVFKAGTDSPLLRLRIRDSATYFLTIGSLVLTNCLIWAAAPSAWSQFVLCWEIVLPCVLGSRLLLNIRERSLEEPTEVSLRSGDDNIVFINPEHGTDGISMPTVHSFSLNTFYDSPKATRFHK